MSRLVILFLLGLFVNQAYGQTTANPSPEIKIESPDGKLKVIFTHKEITPRKPGETRRQMTYRVDYLNKPVILESGLGVQVDNHVFENAMAHKVTSQPGTFGADWCDDLILKSVEKTAKDTTWKPVYGERSTIRDQYNQMDIGFEKAGSPDYGLHMIFRVYNAGVAFRYYFPEHPGGMYYRVAAENSEFTLPAETKAWYAAWAQGPYSALPLSGWPESSERPLTLSLPNALFASLAEAELTDYAMTKFKLSPSKPGTVVTSMYESVDLMSDAGTPWRVVMVARRPGQLLEQNDIMLNLNPPATVKDTEWIKPGKILREMTLTTEGAIACIDFAAAHNLQYILFDWKWYGPAFSFKSDAGKVVAPIDMPKVIAYGNSKNVGVFLYVNLQALYKQLDDIFPLYKQWGGKGVKFGFVEVGSHRWTAWLTEAKRKALENNLLVNIHDEYRPTGTSRTYPNVLTQEGIRGNEEFPDATHNTVLPFTRYLAGAGDYTICYYDKRLKNTHAHQLAMNVISYSPLQSVFWYDKPAQYEDEPEIEFFAKVPTVWDDTRVIHDAIGEYVTIARRSGNDWFVGTITNNDGRSVKLPLDFLPKGKTYDAHIYFDDPTAPGKTHVGVRIQTVKAGEEVDVKLLPRGGQAIWLTPTQSPYGFAPVDQQIRQWVDKGYYKGASLVVVKGGEPIFEHYYGSFTPQTQVYIASAGKWLAAAVIAALVEQGKLNWNDKVVKWLPDWTDMKGQATLRQLLSHTAGYPDYQPKGNRPDDYQTLAESIIHIKPLPAVAAPGTQFSYGGLAMQVAGRMAELASGKDWATLFREEIAQPLGMTHTYFTPVDSTGGHNPMLGGGARSTMADYLRFLDMIFHEGVYDGRRILSKRAVRYMQANQLGNASTGSEAYVRTAYGNDRADIYGLGEWRAEVDGKGTPTLITSPGWAGAYPWIDRTHDLYGFFLAHIQPDGRARDDRFNAFYASPVLPKMVRQAITPIKPVMGK